MLYKNYKAFKLFIYNRNNITISKSFKLLKSHFKVNYDLGLSCNAFLL